MKDTAVIALMKVLAQQEKGLLTQDEMWREIIEIALKALTEGSSRER